MAIDEGFRGPLLFLSGRQLPDLSKIFDDFVAVLRARAEEEMDRVDETALAEMETGAGQGEGEQSIEGSRFNKSQYRNRAIIEYY